MKGPLLIAMTLENIRDRYLSLLKSMLTNTIYEDPNVAPWGPHGFDHLARAEGADWPRDAHTMIGRLRLDSLDGCIRTVIEECVPGDLVETGAWRGGASILMRGALAAYEEAGRTVWVADSFRGLPKPDVTSYPADRHDQHYQVDYLAVPLDEVEANFSKYDLLDDQVRFLPGWFKETLRDAPISQVAVLRLDGDMYESTWDSLAAFVPKMANGGFVIVDDYHAVPGCRDAVDRYREEHDITRPLETIDWAGVYWRC